MKIRKSSKAILAVFAVSALLTVGGIASAQPAEAQILCGKWVLNTTSCFNQPSPPSCFAVKRNLWTCDK